MKLKNNLFRLILISLFITTTQTTFAQDYIQLITEEYLRNEFTFGVDEAMKYEVCKKKSYPTCDYVWGEPSKRDATRIKYGMAPDGNKVMVIYAQSKKPSDFERSIAVYRDAVEIKGIGTRSVWSAARAQLSLITESNLIIHVNLEMIKDGKTKEHAINIAKHVLKQL